MGYVHPMSVNVLQAQGITTLMAALPRWIQISVTLNAGRAAAVTAGVTLGQQIAVQSSGDVSIGS